MVWQPVWEKENNKLKPVNCLLKIGFVLPTKRGCYIYIYIYTKVGWKVPRLTKILWWNTIKWVLFYSEPHISSIDVAVFGSHWSKKSSTQYMTSSYELFSLPSYIYIYIYIYISCESSSLLLWWSCAITLQTNVPWRNIFNVYVFVDTCMLISNVDTGAFFFCFLVEGRGLFCIVLFYFCFVFLFCFVLFCFLFCFGLLLLFFLFFIYRSCKKLLFPVNILLAEWNKGKKYVSFGRLKRGAGTRQKHSERSYIDRKVKSCYRKTATGNVDDSSGVKCNY